MASRFFQIGDLIWARLEPHILRPGIIVQPIGLDIGRCEPAQYVKLFGNHELVCLQESQLLQHTEEILEQAEHWPEDPFVAQAIIELKRELAKQEGEDEELSPLFKSHEYYLNAESVSGEESLLSLVDSNLEEDCSFLTIGDSTLLPVIESTSEEGCTFLPVVASTSGEESSLLLVNEPTLEKGSSHLSVVESAFGKDFSHLLGTESLGGTLADVSSFLPEKRKILAVGDPKGPNESASGDVPPSGPEEFRLRYQQDVDEISEEESSGETEIKKRKLSNSMPNDEIELLMKINRWNDLHSNHSIQPEKSVCNTSKSNASKHITTSYYDAASKSYASTSDNAPASHAPASHAPASHAPASHAPASHAPTLLGTIPDIPILVDNEISFNNTASASEDPLLNKPKPSTSLPEVSKSSVTSNYVQINVNKLSSNDYISISSINRTSFNYKSAVEKSVKSYSQNQDTEIDRIFEKIVKNCRSRDAGAPEYVRATEKEIGVLGIGQMGSAIVKNLLDTGHYITMWNLHPEKILKDFLDDGAEMVKNPSDLIKKCDIVFCCLSDEKAVDEVFNGVNGILQGFKNEKSKNEKSKNENSKNKKSKNKMSKNKESLKGFVQLTSLDPKISKKLSDAISEEGGRYLEVSLLGSKEHAQNRSLILICAGDDLLFQDCFTCFASNSRDAFYMGKHVGRATELKVILSLITGASNVALQEAVSLVVQKQLPLNIFMDFISKEGPNSCPAIRNRANALMVVSNTDIVESIHSHKEGFLLSSLLTACSEKSMKIAASVNNYYLTAKKLYQQ